MSALCDCIVNRRAADRSDRSTGLVKELSEISRSCTRADHVPRQGKTPYYNRRWKNSIKTKMEGMMSYLHCYTPAPRTRTSNKLCPRQKFLYVYAEMLLISNGVRCQTKMWSEERKKKNRKKNRFRPRNIWFLSIHIRKPSYPKRLFKLFMTTRAVI